MKVQKQTVTTDANGIVLSFKIENVEWNPPKIVRGMQTSKSALAIMALKVGESKRITHPDINCRMEDSANGKNKQRSCSLQAVIYKMRKQGWELEYYHEADHILVIRRLK